MQRPFLRPPGRRLLSHASKRRHSRAAESSGSLFAAFCFWWVSVIGSGGYDVVRMEKLTAGAIKAGHNRSHRHSRYLGDFAIAQLMKLAQHENLAQRHRQALN